MSKVTLHLSGKKDDVTELFGIPAQFTENQAGAPTYLKSVYIKANSKGVKAVGASEDSALGMTSTSVNVLVPGEGLFLASNINTILSTFSAGDDIELVLLANGSYTVSQIDGPQSVSDDSVTIDASTHIPDVGDFHPDNFISVDPNEFCASLGIVATAAHAESPHPVFRGVFYRRIGKEMFIAGSNGGSSYSSLKFDLSTDIETPDDAVVQGVLHPANTTARAALMRSGDVMTIHTSDDGSAHFQVRSKGEVIYHIRISQLTSGTGISKYPIHKLAAANTGLLHMSDHRITLDRLEFIDLLSKGVTIGSLDQTSHMGAHRQVNIYIERAEETDPSSIYSITGRVYSGDKQKDSESGEIGYTGDVRFEDSFELQSQEGFNNEHMAFSFRYGIYGSIIRSIPIDGAIVIHLNINRKLGIPFVAQIADIPDLEEFKKKSVLPKDKNEEFDLALTPKFLTTIAIDGLYLDQYQD